LPRFPTRHRRNHFHVSNNNNNNNNNKKNKNIKNPYNQSQKTLAATRVHSILFLGF